MEQQVWSLGVPDNQACDLVSSSDKLSGADYTPFGDSEVHNPFSTKKINIIALVFASFSSLLFPIFYVRPS